MPLQRRAATQESHCRRTCCVRTDPCVYRFLSCGPNRDFDHVLDESSPLAPREAVAVHSETQLTRAPPHVW